MNAIEIYENAIRMFEINGEITLGEFEDMIKPLEDVAPVVHGKWIDGRCTNCHIALNEVFFILFDEPISYVDLKYCPFCGADMRGGEDEK